MKIGDVEINGQVILAPMAGVSTLAYREFMKPFGIALSYSEMISDCGLAYGNKETLRYCLTSKTDRPVGLQLFGASLETTSKAIGILENTADYDILDLNLGCPVYKVVKTGAGSAWLKDPNALYEYVRGVCRVSHKPVTAKIRLGWDQNSINVREVAALLEKAGCRAFAVHARTQTQGYSGTADFSLIKDLNKDVSIPFAVSGDIFTPEAAASAMKISGASFVMVARGPLGRPNLVKDINSFLKDGTVGPSPTVIDQVTWAEDFANRLVTLEGERMAIMQLRGLIPHFFNSFPGYKRIRLAISENTHRMSDLEKIFDSIKTRGQL